MRIQIIHNPNAGAADHSKEEIINKVPEKGNKIKYISTDDEDWEKFLENKPELIYVAGGDGTFHKVAGLLLEKAPNAQIPIKILAFGTANNIAKTINFSKGFSKNKSENIKFSTGIIKGISEEKYFFESIGFGVFPHHLKKMNSYSEIPSPKNSILNTLKLFHSHCSDFKAKKARVKVNGLTIKGSFLLIELMNIKFVGPNLPLTTEGNPADNFLELVIIPKMKRKEFSRYISHLEKGEFSEALLLASAIILRTNKVKIKWKGNLLHVDDNLISDYEGGEITMELDKSLTVLQEKNTDTEN